MSVLAVLNGVIALVECKTRGLILTLLTGLLCSGLVARAQTTAPLPNVLSRFASGVDISEVKTLQDHGAIYRAEGVAQNPLHILRRAGVNWVRIRLFVHPDGNGPLTNDLSYALAEAKAAKRDHFLVLLDMHFSDSWADPSQQRTPAVWANLSHTQLVQQVKQYSAVTLRSFYDVKAIPDMIEVGNEITNGMLWPDGQLTWNGNDDENWQRLTDLLKAGVDGIRLGVSPHKRPLIMIHIDKGGDLARSRAFFDRILDFGVGFDVIGLSDYPWWQGTLEQLSNNLSSLALSYRKPIIVVETGFPWSPQTFNVEGKVSSGASAETNVLHFPASLNGQADYLDKLIATVRATPNRLGIGVFYWAGMWIKNDTWGAPEWSGDWEARALFDRNGDAVPALFSLGAAGKLRTR